MKSAMNWKCIAAVAAIGLLTVACASTSMLEKCTTQQFESFDTDPGWDGHNNRLTALNQTIVRQRFGWRPSNLAGGEAGEIGGVVWRSARQASYSMPIGPLTLDDPLEFSGKFSLSQVTAVNQWHTGSVIYIGFFNSDYQGWRPINHVGFRFMGQRDYEFETYEGIPVGAHVEVTYGVKNTAAGGAAMTKSGEGTPGVMREWKQSSILRIVPDGKPHTWKMTYDPDGNNGYGMIEFTVDDGEPRPIPIRKDHRESGATFDRFGIFNEKLPGYQMTGFFDDITVNGANFDFTENPKWIGIGNQDEFVDPDQYGANRFGYSQTQYAGGEKPGELGGRIWEVYPTQEWIQGHYGADVGQLSLDDKLVARGKLAIPEFGTDSGFHFGWFNAADQSHSIDRKTGPRNFVGVLLNTMSDFGRFISPMYGTSGKLGGMGGVQIRFMPDGRIYDWELIYDPQANEGNGAMTFQLGDQVQTLNLAEGAREDGASLNRFGVFNLQDNNGKYCDAYLDDLEFTSAK